MHKDRACGHGIRLAARYSIAGTVVSRHASSRHPAAKGSVLWHPEGPFGLNIKYATPVCAKPGWCILNTGKALRQLASVLSESRLSKETMRPSKPSTRQAAPSRHRAQLMARSFTAGCKLLEARSRCCTAASSLPAHRAEQGLLRCPQQAQRQGQHGGTFPSQ